MSTFKLLTPDQVAAAGKKATRAAFGETMVKLVEEGLDIYAVDADLSGSTTTGKLGAAYPDRLVNVGIAEQNMIDVAAGLALAGKTVFTGSFAMFGTGRVYDQIRNTVAYSSLNVKIAPTHSGVSVGPDGGSHQMLEDIALMSVIPNMRVLVPADYAAAASAIRVAATTPGPVYVRLGRAGVPAVYEYGSELAIGSAYVLRPGTDVTILACGLEVAQALIAAEKLSTQGISAEVIDLFSVKPLDEETILASVAKTGRVVTAEEHMLNGGMGSLVASLLAEKLPTPMARVGVKDKFGTSGDIDELLATYELDAPAIEDAVKAVCAS